MKASPGKRRIAIIALVVCAVARLGEAAPTSEDEPEYKGKRLSEWLATAYERGTMQQTAEAVRAIGSKAVPFLVKWIDSWESPSRVKMIEDFEDLPEFARSSYAGPPPGVHPVHRIRHAHIGFVLLGEEGKAAVPALTRIVRNSTNWAAPSLAAQSLSCLGTNGMTALIELVTDRTLDSGRRKWAVAAMGNLAYLGSNALPCVPVMVQEEIEDKSAIKSGAPWWHFHNLMQPIAHRFMHVNWSNAVPDIVVRRALAKALADSATNVSCFHILSDRANDPDPIIRAEVKRGIEMHEEYGRTH